MYYEHQGTSKFRQPLHMYCLFIDLSPSSLPLFFHYLSLHAGIDFKKKTIVLEGKRIKLQIWYVSWLIFQHGNIMHCSPSRSSSLPPCRDTAGQEKFHTITPKLYCGANVSRQLACDIREHVILICIVGGVVTDHMTSGVWQFVNWLQCLVNTHMTGYYSSVWHHKTGVICSCHRMVAGHWEGMY